MPIKISSCCSSFEYKCLRQSYAALSVVAPKGLSIRNGSVALSRERSLEEGRRGGYERILTFKAEMMHNVLPGSQATKMDLVA